MVSKSYFWKASTRSRGSCTVNLETQLQLSTKRIPPTLYMYIWTKTTKLSTNQLSTNQLSTNQLSTNQLSTNHQPICMGLLHDKLASCVIPAIPDTVYICIGMIPDIYCSRHFMAVRFIWDCFVVCSYIARYFTWNVASIFMVILSLLYGIVIIFPGRNFL